MNWTWPDSPNLFAWDNLAIGWPWLAANKFISIIIHHHVRPYQVASALLASFAFSALNLLLPLTTLSHLNAFSIPSCSSLSGTSVIVLSLLISS